MNSMEYVIWGIPKNGVDEQLLLAKFEGKPITSKITANNLKKVLEEKFGCTDTRIQEIDLTDNKINFL